MNKTQEQLQAKDLCVALLEVRNICITGLNRLGNFRSTAHRWTSNKAHSSQEINEAFEQVLAVDITVIVRVQIHHKAGLVRYMIQCFENKVPHFASSRWDVHS